MRKIHIFAFKFINDGLMLFQSGVLLLATVKNSKLKLLQ
jgi:hypothetical protein